MGRHRSDVRTGISLPAPEVDASGIMAGDQRPRMGRRGRTHRRKEGTGRYEPCLRG